MTRICDKVTYPKMEQKNVQPMLLHLLVKIYWYTPTTSQSGMKTLHCVRF